jgi:HSP20 family protein
MIRKEENSLFDLFFNGEELFHDSFNKKFKRNNVIPKINSFRNNDEFILNVYLPGYNKKDISIKADKTLIISGERKIDVPKDSSILMKEAFDETFERSFSLDDDIDLDNIDASFKDGVLTIKLKKLEAKKEKQIEIR